MEQQSCQENGTMPGSFQSSVRRHSGLYPLQPPRFDVITGGVQIGLHPPSIHPTTGKIATHPGGAKTRDVRRHKFRPPKMVQFPFPPFMPESADSLMGFDRHFSGDLGPHLRLGIDLGPSQGVQEEMLPDFRFPTFSEIFRKN